MWAIIFFIVHCILLICVCFYSEISGPWTPIFRGQYYQFGDNIFACFHPLKMTFNFTPNHEQDFKVLSLWSRKDRKKKGYVGSKSKDKRNNASAVFRDRELDIVTSKCGQKKSATQMSAKIF